MWRRRSGSGVGSLFLIRLFFLLFSRRRADRQVLTAIMIGSSRLFLYSLAAATTTTTTCSLDVFFVPLFPEDFLFFLEAVPYRFRKT